MDFARDLMVMVLLHDITMCDTFTAQWHQLWDQLEMRKAVFTGYYTTPAVEVVTSNPNVKTALYRWKNSRKAVLIIGNTQNTPQSFRIDDSKLKLQDKAKDLFNNCSVDLRQKFEFKDFDFRVLEVFID